MTKTLTKTAARKMEAAKKVVAQAKRAEIGMIEKFQAGELVKGDTFVMNNVTYVADKFGRAVRQTTNEHRATKEEVTFVLKNTRLVDEAEALFMIGKGCTDWLIENGYLFRDPRHPDQLWVSKAAQARYGLVHPFAGPTGSVPKGVDYVTAAPSYK